MKAVREWVDEYGITHVELENGETCVPVDELPKFLDRMDARLVPNAESRAMLKMFQATKFMPLAARLRGAKALLESLGAELPENFLQPRPRLVRKGAGK